MADVRELLAIGGLDVVGHGGVSGLQTAPDLLGGVAPQTILQVGGPAVVAGGDGLEVVVDEDGLDAGGAEFDASVVLPARIFSAMWAACSAALSVAAISFLCLGAPALLSPSLGRVLALTISKKTLYRQPAFDTTYAVSRIITV